MKFFEISWIFFAVFALHRPLAALRCCSTRGRFDMQSEAKTQKKPTGWISPSRSVYRQYWPIT